MAVTSTIVGALGSWIGDQRWFAGKSRAPTLRAVGSVEFRAQQDARITTYLVLDESARPAVLYQIPITARLTPLAAAEHAQIATVADEHGRRLHLYDGPHDPVFAQALLQLIVDGATIEGEAASARGIPETRTICRNVHSHVLRGEQSNTSIVYSFDSGDDTPVRQVICKLFRTLHHGENPDVVLQSALFEAGSHSVPAALGSVVGEWTQEGVPGGRARGHLAFAQEFLAGADDAWRLALAAANAGTDFTARARQIGIATADVHSTLAMTMPTRQPTPDDIEQIISGWHRRLDAAIREVPQFEAVRGSISALYARAQILPWPSLQRIHGDLHLGQILAMPNGQWVIIDFEGEPMRPLAERSLLDVPLRDVAGMLRSFDYVAGAGDDVPRLHAWARACRHAFMDGYAQRAGEGVRRYGVLLDAFELDKALYEAVYEARNRPGWLRIPSAAVHRLAARAGQAHSG
jgi:maltokinase